MTTVVDTNVLFSILQTTDPHHRWALREFRTIRNRGPVIVCDLVYSEMSVGMKVQSEVDAVIDRLSLERYPQDDASLFRAGKAFLAYRRNKGPKTRVLPDFVIGAIAETIGASLITADVDVFRTYFPSVKVIGP